MATLKSNEYLSDEKIAFYKEKWLQIGLNTDPINVDLALHWVKQLYVNVGLTPPDDYEVCESPFAAVSLLKDKYDVPVQSNSFGFGSFDSYWLSFYDVFLTEYGITACEKLKPHIEVAKHCGWYLAFENLIVIVDRPVHIKFDAEKRSHCDDDFAIKYSDGTGVAVWHGTRIPAKWVKDKSSITVHDCLHNENIELRRCACEIIGWATLLELIPHTVIDTDPDPEIGMLIEAELPDVGVERFLVATDPNRNSPIGLPVPRTMKTALEANSWTYGIDPVEFTPDFRV